MARPAFAPIDTDALSLVFCEARESRSCEWHDLRGRRDHAIVMKSIPVHETLGNTPATAPGEVTRLLRDCRGGSRDAFDRLFEVVYVELRRIAAGQLRREKAGQTLHPTGLVHELCLKLSGQAEVDFENRGHFFAIAARAMRQIRIDAARRRNADRRGAGERPVTLSNVRLGVAPDYDQLLALDSALDRLDQIEPSLRLVVEYRYFAGFSEGEIASLLGVSERSVQRDWARARAWLYREIYRQSR